MIVIPKDECIQMSPYIENIVKGTNIVNKKYNICVTTGGLKGNYAVGILTYILYLYKNNKISIGNLYGASAGAISLVCLLLSINEENLKIETFIEILYKYRLQYFKTNDKIATFYINEIYKLFPPNFYKVCTNRLFITVTRLKMYGPYKEIITEFKSNEHLKNVLIASASLPYITINSLYTKIDNKYYIDGFHPIISSYNNPVINIDIHSIDYSLHKSLSPLDSCFESLILRGIYDAHLFFKYDIDNDYLFVLLKEIKSNWPKKWLFGAIMILIVYIYKKFNIKILKNIKF